jgi:hypothetical protein
VRLGGRAGPGGHGGRVRGRQRRANSVAQGRGGRAGVRLGGGAEQVGITAVRQGRADGVGQEEGVMKDTGGMEDTRTWRARRT